MANPALADAKKAHKATPNNKATQEKYCREYAKAGYPRHDKIKCLVPWCKRKCKTTFCPIHNAMPSIPVWLEKRWDVDLNAFSKKDWHYSSLEVNYDEYHSCYNGNSDDCVGICRCGRITNARVKSVDRNSIIEEIIKSLITEHTDMQAYCIDRVVRSFIDPSHEFGWDIRVGGGYYGDEIHSVTLDSAAEIAKEVRELLKLETDKERIFYALTAEYGRILPALEPLTNWAIEELPLVSVVLPQIDYRKKLNAKQIKLYEDWKMPRGLVMAEPDGYRVIDGYHRTQSAKNQKLATALFVVGRK